jgi:hypothetical protein
VRKRHHDRLSRLVLRSFGRTPSALSFDQLIVGCDDPEELASRLTGT